MQSEIRSPINSDIEKLHVLDIYEKIAKGFDQKRTKHWSWVNEFIDDLPKKDSLVLDLGCGSGRNMLYLGHSFVGMDACKKFIEICKSKDLNVIQGDMCYIPFPDNHFDAIQCIAAFHHLSSEDRRIRCLLEIKRVLKPDGKILLSVWSINQPKKTRREFNSYGKTMVQWKDACNDKIHERYYHIFKIDEINNLFTNVGLDVLSHRWDCGNEVFVLTAKDTI